MSDFWILAGLGNPGDEHRGQRHNAGYWLVDALLDRHRGSLSRDRKLHSDVARLSLAGQQLLLLKPTTYMNRSGRAVQAAAAYFKVPVEQILVAHDDLDLPVGTVRLKRGGGHGGHNGLRDISACLGGNYARFRIGIGHPGHKDDVLNYVLGRPSAADERLIRDAAQLAAEALPLALDNWDRAVQQLHTRKSMETPE